MSAYGHNKTTRRKPGWNVKDPKTRPETDARNRIDLIPGDFDRLIKQKGAMCKVFRTTFCPNVKSVDGAEHEIDCTICNGSGFIDLDPICTYVYIQAQELDKLPNIEGLVDGNTVMMTFPIGVELQYFTKVELHDFTDIFPQRVMRKPGSLVDVLKYSACRVNVLIGKDGTRYYQELDFTLDLNGNILWLTPGAQQLLTFSAIPDAGTFTITFGSDTTAAIPFSADDEAVETALRAIEGLEDILVTGDFEDGFRVTFVGVDAPVAMATASSSLTLVAAPVDVTITNASKKARKPNNNEPYSIHYEAHTQYRVRAAIHSNRFTQVASGSAVEHIKMPEQWYATKEFLVKRTDGFTGEELQQGPYSKKQVVEDDND
jgi:hypothetical protein